ncbi:hypothetical protein [Nitrobacter vulgaris]|uniref:hypothetical protein n=1 Tax=Nitrobacter vulgaris TaxID=29421 RepID=UPI001116A6DA|nr:hypothetical protein [Nitrobacter vulgaris]
MAESVIGHPSLSGSLITSKKMVAELSKKDTRAPRRCRAAAWAAWISKVHQPFEAECECERPGAKNRVFLFVIATLFA